MTTLHEGVKTTVQLKTCRIHHKHPVISIDDGKFTLLCCCDDFKMECYNKIINLLRQDRSKHLKVAWRKPKINTELH